MGIWSLVVLYVSHVSAHNVVISPDFSPFQVGSFPGGFDIYPGPYSPLLAPEEATSTYWLSARIEPTVSVGHPSILAVDTELDTAGDAPKLEVHYRCFKPGVSTIALQFQLQPPSRAADVTVQKICGRRKPSIGITLGSWQGVHPIPRPCGGPTLDIFDAATLPIVAHVERDSGVLIESIRADPQRSTPDDEPGVNVTYSGSINGADTGVTVQCLRAGVHNIALTVTPFHAFQPFAPVVCTQRVSCGGLRSNYVATIGSRAFLQGLTHEPLVLEDVSWADSQLHFSISNGEPTDGWTLVCGNLSTSANVTVSAVDFTFHCAQDGLFPCILRTQFPLAAVPPHDLAEVEQRKGDQVTTAQERPFPSFITHLSKACGGPEDVVVRSVEVPSANVITAQGLGVLPWPTEVSLPSEVDVANFVLQAPTLLALDRPLAVNVYSDLPGATTLVATLTNGRNLTQLRPEGSDIGIQLTCLQKGDGRVEVVVPIKGAHGVPLTFTFNKQCATAVNHPVMHFVILLVLACVVTGFICCLCYKRQTEETHPGAADSV